MKKIVITGASGLVGSRVVELLHNSVSITPLTQNQCNITQKESVHTFLSSLTYDTIVHLAAYTNVDGAEKEQDLAHQINVVGTENLFQEARENHKEFIYISTDFVFDGTNPPYTEQSVPHPIGYYGQTKLEGEKIVNHEGMIIRIASPYRTAHTGKPDFVQRIRQMLTEKKTLTMVTDSSFTPTYIDDIAQGISHLVHHFEPTIFHLVGSQTVSPFESGKLIANAYGLDTSLIQETTYETYFKDKAKRPQYSEITSARVNFMKMRSFEEGLKIVART